jgi:small multidrug resistance pump
MTTAWLVLVAAVGIEVASSSALPRTDGFRHPGWTAAVLVGYAVSIWLLTVVVDRIPISVAYAFWAGLGTAGIAVVGALFLHQPLNLVKAVALAMIIFGVVLLNLQMTH